MITLATEQDTEDFAAQLAKELTAPMVIYLKGDLGAGKTTLVRGVLNALGHHDIVKSPTYTLVETYPLDDIRLQHFDLYRLNDPEELEYIGVEEYFTDNSVVFIEWPEKGHGLIPKADKVITFDLSNNERKLNIENF